MRILFTLFIGLNFFDSSGQIQKDHLLYQNSKASNWVKVKRPIIIKDYFVFMDSIVQKNDSIVNYELTEHLLEGQIPGLSTPWQIQIITVSLNEIHSFTTKPK